MFCRVEARVLRGVGLVGSGGGGGFWLRLRACRWDPDPFPKAARAPGGLIGEVVRMDDRRGPLTFGDGWRFGLGFWVSGLVVWFLAGLAAFVVAFLVAGAAFFALFRVEGFALLAGPFSVWPCRAGAGLRAGLRPVPAMRVGCAGVGGGPGWSVFRCWKGRWPGGRSAVGGGVLDARSAVWF